MLHTIDKALQLAKSVDLDDANDETSPTADQTIFAHYQAQPDRQLIDSASTKLLKYVKARRKDNILAGVMKATFERPIEKSLLESPRLSQHISKRKQSVTTTASVTTKGKYSLNKCSSVSDFDITD